MLRVKVGIKRITSTSCTAVKKKYFMTENIADNLPSRIQSINTGTSLNFTPQPELPIMSTRHTMS